MLVINETWVDKTQNALCGSSGYYEPYTEDLGELFRSLQREYGRCVSRVYQDNCLDGTSWVNGWVFEKKHKYNDCNEYYLAETWVTYKHVLES